MNLCRIETGDPLEPAYVDPSTVSFLIGRLKPLGIKFYERGIEDARFIGTPLFTTHVVELLEAHEAKRTGTTEREEKLIAGLRRIAGPQSPMTVTGFRLNAASILRDAGVPDAEPEKPLEDERVGR